MKPEPKIPSVQEVMGKTLPDKKFRASPITATIWANEVEREGKKTLFRTVVLDRTYKDKDGEFKSTHSLRLNDLPKAMLVLNKAYEYLALADDSIEEE